MGRNSLPAADGCPVDIQRIRQSGLPASDFDCFLQAAVHFVTLLTT